MNLCEFVRVDNGLITVEHYIDTACVYDSINGDHADWTREQFQRFVLHTNTIIATGAGPDGEAGSVGRFESKQTQRPRKDLLILFLYQLNT